MLFLIREVKCESITNLQVVVIGLEDTKRVLLHFCGHSNRPVLNGIFKNQQPIKTIKRFPHSFKTCVKFVQKPTITLHYILSSHSQFDYFSSFVFDLIFSPL